MSAGALPVPAPTDTVADWIEPLRVAAEAARAARHADPEDAEAETAVGVGLTAAAACVVEAGRRLLLGGFGGGVAGAGDCDLCAAARGDDEATTPSSAPSTSAPSALPADAWARDWGHLLATGDGEAPTAPAPGADALALALALLPDPSDPYDDDATVLLYPSSWLWRARAAGLHLRALDNASRSHGRGATSAEVASSGDLAWRRLAKSAAWRVDAASLAPYAGRAGLRDARVLLSTVRLERGLWEAGLGRRKTARACAAGAAAALGFQAGVGGALALRTIHQRDANAVLVVGARRVCPDGATRWASVGAATWVAEAAARAEGGGGIGGCCSRPSSNAPAPDDAPAAAVPRGGTEGLDAEGDSEILPLPLLLRPTMDNAEGDRAAAITQSPSPAPAAGLPAIPAGLALATWGPALPPAEAALVGCCPALGHHLTPLDEDETGTNAAAATAPPRDAEEDPEAPPPEGVATPRAIGPRGGVGDDQRRAHDECVEAHGWCPPAGAPLDAAARPGAPLRAALFRRAEREAGRPRTQARGVLTLEWLCGEVGSLSAPPLAGLWAAHLPAASRLAERLGGALLASGMPREALAVFAAAGHDDAAVAALRALGRAGEAEAALGRRLREAGWDKEETSGEWRQLTRGNDDVDVDAATAGRRAAARARGAAAVPRLLCALGDLADSPAYWRAAWATSKEAAEVKGGGREKGPKGPRPRPLARAVRALAAHAQRSGNDAEAAHLWAEALRLSPLDADGWFALGHARLRGADRAGASLSSDDAASLVASAAAAFGRAASLKVDDAEAWNNLGALRLRSADGMAATARNELNPAVSRALVKRARAEARRAAGALAEAARLDATRWHVWENLARAASLGGRVADAPRVVRAVLRVARITRGEGGGADGSGKGGAPSSSGAAGGAGRLDPGVWESAAHLACRALVGARNATVEAVTGEANEAEVPAAAAASSLATPVGGLDLGSSDADDDTAEAASSASEGTAAVDLGSDYDDDAESVPMSISTEDAAALAPLGLGGGADTFSATLAGRRAERRRLNARGRTSRAGQTAVVLADLWTLWTAGGIGPHTPDGWAAWARIHRAAGEPPSTAERAEAEAAAAAPGASVRLPAPWAGGPTAAGRLGGRARERECLARAVHLLTGDAWRRDEAAYSALASAHIALAEAAVRHASELAPSSCAEMESDEDRKRRLAPVRALRLGLSGLAGGGRRVWPDAEATGRLGAALSQVDAALAA